MRPFLSKQVQQQVPILKIAADQGTHPPVGLDRPVCVVGRHDYANLPLPAKAVSKLHALIVREQRRVYLRDLASTNGVDVNGAAVRETDLSDADVIRIGAFTLRCQSGFGKDGVRPASDGNGAATVDGDGGAAARAPQAELRSQAGNFSFPPGRHTLLIGQREGCEVRLKHETILPVHAVVFELDGKHYVQTFAPELMTRVNGKPVHREELNPGDELRIGKVALRYALVDLSAESVGQPGAATDTGGGTGTGESLIQPALDSSIAPAIDDPAHHGELEAEAEEAAFDVVDAEAGEESLIQPAMESSIAPAMGSAAGAAAAGAGSAAGASAASGTPVEATDDFGLDIEPLAEPLAEAAGDAEGDVAPLAEASLDVEPLDVEPPDVEALEIEPVADAGGEAKSARPAAPPRAETPAEQAIDEPVVEPIVERAAEHGIAAAIDAPAAAAGKPPVDDMARSMDGDEFDGNSSFDLEPLRASDDLEPIDINAEPEPPADEAAGGGGDLAESIRAAWDGPKQRDVSKLSATYDEDSELDIVDSLGKSKGGGGDDGRLSATLDEDDAMMPLTDVADDADLLGVDDHIDLIEAAPQGRATEGAPAAEPPEPPSMPVADVASPAPTADVAASASTTDVAKPLVEPSPQARVGVAVTSLSSQAD